MSHSVTECSVSCSTPAWAQGLVHRSPRAEKRPSTPLAGKDPAQTAGHVRASSAPMAASGNARRTRQALPPASCAASRRLAGGGLEPGPPPAPPSARFALCGAWLRAAAVGGGSRLRRPRGRRRRRTGLGRRAGGRRRRGRSAMGNLFGRKKQSRVTEQDKAVLVRPGARAWGARGARPGHRRGGAASRPARRPARGGSAARPGSRAGVAAVRAWAEERAPRGVGAGRGDTCARCPAGGSRRISGSGLWFRGRAGGAPLCGVALSPRARGGESWAPAAPRARASRPEVGPGVRGPRLRPRVWRTPGGSRGVRGPSGAAFSLLPELGT